MQYAPTYAAFFPGVVAALVFGKVGVYLAECCADGGFFGFAVRVLQFGLQQGFGRLIPFVTSGLPSLSETAAVVCAAFLPNSCVTSLCRLISLATASLSKLFFRRPECCFTGK